MTSLAEVRVRLLEAAERQTFAEPTLYYALVRACEAHSPAATSAQLIAVLAGQLVGENLGKRFDAVDAIDADEIATLREALERLAKIIDLATSDASAGEVAAQVANHYRFLRLL